MTRPCTENVDCIAIPLRILDTVQLFRGGSRIMGKGGSDKHIHNWGRVREGACPLP